MRTVRVAAMAKQRQEFLPSSVLGIRVPTPITEIPGRWPRDYRRLGERRIKKIEADRNVRLIEQPECKRRWTVEPWESQLERALRKWLLDRLEACFGDLAGETPAPPPWGAGIPHAERPGGRGQAAAGADQLCEAGGSRAGLRGVRAGGRDLCGPGHLLRWTQRLFLSRGCFRPASG